MSNTDDKPGTYQLVLITGGKVKEEVLFSSPNLLEVELRREQHIRSITQGYVEIRRV